jgi:hypothetical protein
MTQKVTSSNELVTQSQIASQLWHGYHSIATMPKAKQIKHFNYFQRTKTYDGNLDAERHQCTNLPVKRPIAALDAGNRTTQWIDPANVVRTIPSCIKMLEDWEEAQPDSGSVLIEVLTNSGEIQERFIIGEEAQRQKGVSAFTGNKCEMAKRLVYAALEPIPGTNTVIFDYLRVALP